MRPTGSLVEAHGLLSCGMRTLSCGMRVGSSSLARIEPGPPALRAQSLNHCATREVPRKPFEAFLFLEIWLELLQLYNFFNI